MSELVKSSLVLRPADEAADSFVPAPIAALVAALPEVLVIGDEEGPPRLIELASLFDACQIELRPDRVTIELVDERRIDEEALDALIGERHFDDVDPAELATVPSSSSLDDTEGKPRPIAQLPDIPEIIQSLVAVVGKKWKLYRNGELVSDEEFDAAMNLEPGAATLPPGLGLPDFLDGPMPPGLGGLLDMDMDMGADGDSGNGHALTSADSLKSLFESLTSSTGALDAAVRGPGGTLPDGLDDLDDLDGLDGLGGLGERPGRKLGDEAGLSNPLKAAMQALAGPAPVQPMSQAGRSADEAPPPSGPRTLNDEDYVSWASAVVRQLVGEGSLELATVHDSRVVGAALAEALEDAGPGELPVGKIADALIDLPGVVELYAGDDDLLEALVQNRPR